MNRKQKFYMEANKALEQRVGEKDARINELEQFLKKFAQEATLLDFRGSQLFTKESLPTEDKEEVCEMPLSYRHQSHVKV